MNSWTKLGEYQRIVDEEIGPYNPSEISVTMSLRDYDREYAKKYRLLLGRVFLVTKEKVSKSGYMDEHRMWHKTEFETFLDYIVFKDYGLFKRK